MTSLIVHLKTEVQEKAVKAVLEAFEVSFQKFENEVVNDCGLTSKKRTAGLAKGLIKMKDDFDAPLEDFKEYQ